MNKEDKRRKYAVKVASHVPGRLRIKLGAEFRKPYVMESLSDRMREKEGIVEVKTNHAAGSITIRYDHQRHHENGIYQILEDADVIISDLTGAEHLDQTGSESGEKGTPQTFISAVDDLNKRLSKASGIKVDLKTALPVSLAGLGFLSIARNGLGIDRIPGVLLLWLAFDAFVRLHPHHLHS